MGTESTAQATLRTPFQTLPLKSGTVMQRVLRRHPRENAWIEVNNLLASVPAVRQVRPEQIARIAEKYRMPLRGQFLGRLERFYRDYLIYCLADARLSAEELSDLAHLKRILRLDDRVVCAIHERVAMQVYAQTVDAVLADGRIDAVEREFLHTLQEHLAISRKTVERIMSAKRRQMDAERTQHTEWPQHS
jgi:hypothetical protein